MIAYVCRLKWNKHYHNVSAQMVRMGWLAAVREWQIAAAFIDHGAHARQQPAEDRPAYLKLMLEAGDLDAAAVLVTHEAVLRSKKLWRVGEEVEEQTGMPLILADCIARCEYSRECDEPVIQRALSTDLGAWILVCRNHCLDLIQKGWNVSDIPNQVALPERIFDGTSDSAAFNHWTGRFETDEGDPDGDRDRGDLADWGVSV